VDKTSPIKEIDSVTLIKQFYPQKIMTSTISVKKFVTVYFISDILLFIS
jgi:hypothetical protein